MHHKIGPVSQKLEEKTTGRQTKRERMRRRLVQMNRTLFAVIQRRDRIVTGSTAAAR